MLSQPLWFFILLNAALVVVFGVLSFRRDLLAVFTKGRWWLTWFAVALITIMDELTSIFYAPAEAFRVIGMNAVVFILVTSILIRLLSMRMIEIAEILEHHGLRGGGVYSFSNLVLGPVVGFAAVGSIVVDYVLTACISAVSAVSNGFSFTTLPHALSMSFQVAILWFVAGLNILGIRENARVNFAIFAGAAVLLLNLVAGGLFHHPAEAWHRTGTAFLEAGRHVIEAGPGHAVFWIVACVSACVLAYSGIESVLQTGAILRSWKDVRSAYIFLALTTGIFTPLLAMLVLSANMDPMKHHDDLIASYAALVGGPWFGIVIGLLASVLLVMAVNTAFVALSELLEKVAHRYNLNWIIQTNRFHSLWRVHILSALAFSALVIATNGNQETLADMYALGLIASFSINLGSLLIYRYFQGTRDRLSAHSSRLGTLALFLIFAGCFFYIAWHKPWGTALWGSVTLSFLVIGATVGRHSKGELAERAKSDTPMEAVFAAANLGADRVHVHFMSPLDHGAEAVLARRDTLVISLFSPRQKLRETSNPRHLCMINTAGSINEGIMEVLWVFAYELPQTRLTVHFGWPRSGWIDRLATGFMVMNMMKLPKEFPQYEFVIEHRASAKDAGAADEAVRITQSADANAAPADAVPPPSESAPPSAPVPVRAAKRTAPRKTAGKAAKKRKKS